MPNLFSNLIECFGFSQIMNLTSFKTFIALKLISFRFPIGVAIIYKPLFILFITILFTIINSCSPVNYSINQKPPTNLISKNLISKEEIKNKKINIVNNNINEVEFYNKKILSEIEIILPKNDNQKLTKDLKTTWILISN